MTTFAVVPPGLCGDSSSSRHAGSPCPPCRHLRHVRYKGEAEESQHWKGAKQSQKHAGSALVSRSGVQSSSTPPCCVISLYSSLFMAPCTCSHAKGEDSFLCIYHSLSISEDHMAFPLGTCCLGDHPGAWQLSLFMSFGVHVPGAKQKPCTHPTILSSCTCHLHSL